MKSGFVAIIGRPNAGKSTLLNAILGEKIAITTYKAQTTRNAILGILNKPELQIVFIDTPGIHESHTALDSYMNKEAMSQAAGVDCIYYIIDGNYGLQDEDLKILEQVKTYESPIFLLVNKTDELSQNKLMTRLTFASSKFEFNEIIPISALNKNNLDELLETTKKYLNDDVQYYPSDVKTNMNIEFQISEIIREKIIINTQKEIPHLVAVKVEEIKERESKVYIEASIICNKTSHKAIIIGKNGQMLKRINDNASSDIAKLYNKRIILSLYVKVEEDWLNKEKKLFDLGYFKGDQDE